MPYTMLTNRLGVGDASRYTISHRKDRKTSETFICVMSMFSAHQKSRQVGKEGVMKALRHPVASALSGGRYISLRMMDMVPNRIRTRRLLENRRKEFVCQGLFGNLFGNREKDEEEEKADIQPEDWSNENLDEAVLFEVPSDSSDASTRLGIVYRNGAVVDANELENLCDKVGWPKRPIEKVEAALANSYLVASLTLEEIKESERDGGDALEPCGQARKLIGLARCTSDGAFNATVWDVLVDPEFQGKGLGKTIVERLVRTLLRKGITNITLFADEKVVSFYKQLGFQADPEGIRGMFWYPKW